MGTDCRPVHQRSRRRKHRVCAFTEPAVCLQRLPRRLYQGHRPGAASHAGMGKSRGNGYSQLPDHGRKPCALRKLPENNRLSGEGRLGCRRQRLPRSHPMEDTSGGHQQSHHRHTKQRIHHGGERLGDLSPQFRRIRRSRPFGGRSPATTERGNGRRQPELRDLPGELR